MIFLGAMVYDRFSLQRPRNALLFKTRLATLLKYHVIRDDREKELLIILATSIYSIDNDIR